MELGRARADLEGEDWDEAERRLLALAQAHPEELDIGFALQDLRLAQVARGLPPAGLDREGHGGSAAVPLGADPKVLALERAAQPDGLVESGAQDVVARLYAEQLHSSPSVPNLVLAARVQRDPAQALAWLGQALSLDPTCAWAHYGRAHALLRMRDQYRWRNSREALELALEIDPTHLHARRLEAWMLAQEGAGEPAAWAIERWLIATEFDPRVRHEHRVAARLDLARVWLALGATELALRELETLEGEPIGRARRLLLLAVARTEKEDIDGALQAVRQASLIRGVGVLPFVQEALLREHWLQDREGSLALWKNILDEAEQSSDPAVILQAFRARVVLERGATALQAEAGVDPTATDQAPDEGTP